MNVAYTLTSKEVAQACAEYAAAKFGGARGANVVVALNASPECDVLDRPTGSYIITASVSFEVPHATPATNP